MANNNDDKILLDLYNQMQETAVCMLTTRAIDGSLHSRPMFTNKVEISGRLWFFTSDRTLKVSEIENSPEVNLSFNKDNGESYISVSGKAMVVKDRDKARELWTDSLKQWFPEGLAEPGLSLIEVDAEDIAYWISEDNKLKKAFHFAKTFVTGDDTDDQTDSGNIHLG